MSELRSRNFSSVSTIVVTAPTLNPSNEDQPFVRAADAGRSEPEGMVAFVAPRSGDPLRRDGGALISVSGERFPIVNGIPRFVQSEGYAASFGIEWQIHSLTQLDSRTGTNISRQRLERCLGAPVESLSGKAVLEAGCGAGRFTELLVEAGARVHAIDLSTAVDVNRRNIGERANYVIAQADLNQPPFPQGAFDLVLCVGVLQHTPSPEEGLRALWSMVKPGGGLVIDHYAWELSLVTKLTPVYRLVVKRLRPATAKQLTDRLVAGFFPLHWSVRRIYPLQALLSRVSPCLVYFRAFPQLTREQQYELCRLDTFDQLADQYKRLRTAGQVRRMFTALHAEDIRIRRGGNGVEGRCRKPVRNGHQGTGTD